MKSKLKIVKAKPVVTDEEIQGFMNFDALVNDAKSEKKRLARLRAIRNTSIVALILLLSQLIYTGLKNQNTPTQQPAPKSATETQPLADTVQTLPNPEKRDSVLKKIEVKKEKLPVIKKQEPPTSQPEPAKELEPKPAEPLVQKTDSVSKPTTPLFVKAEPVDGFPYLYEYFRIELQYPEAAVKDSISGVVMVSFIINRQGKPENITVLNSLGPAFDEEVLRLIENMPDWKPATRDAVPIPSKISMPLTFKHQRIKVK